MTILPRRRSALLVALAGAAALLAALAPLSEATLPGKPGRIAYSAELPGEDQSGGGTVDRGFDIFSVNPDGSNPLRLTQNGAEPDSEVSPAWSPSGSSIAFSAQFPFDPMAPYPARPDSVISLMNADGSSPQVILGNSAGGGGPSGPVFFPNGQRIFFGWTAVDLLQSGVRSAKLDGSDAQDETADLYKQYGHNISPDGKRMLYSSGSPADVFVSKIDGSGATNLTNTPAVSEFTPAFAPDASAIVFTAQDVPAFPPLTSVITVMEPKSGTRTAISPATDLAISPAWGRIPVRCGSLTATLVGTAGKDTLVGTKGKDVIAGLAGRDTLKGKGGNDVLCGGKGKDRLSAGKGKRDRCIGGKGRDRSGGCELGKGD